MGPPQIPTKSNNVRLTRMECLEMIGADSGRLAGLMQEEKAIDYG
jgi:hypothetical protein